MTYPPNARGYDGFGGRAETTFAGSRPWWPDEPRAQAGAPNIVVVLVDDLGYSDVSPFGSEIDTPAIQASADRGVVLSNYHTAPVCSPARAALLTGVNQHRAGYATVAAFDPGFPNLRFEIAPDVVTLPEALRENGYATYAVGKWHLSRDSSVNEGSDQRSWPVQRGFDRYYGCLEGFTSMFAPHRLLRDNSPLVIDEYPDDYYLTDDLTDQAIAMIRSLRAHDQDKPFFLYFAHHAVHAPLGAKPADMEKYRGRYDAGWEVLRLERFERQRELGLFENGVRLPDGPEPGLRFAVPRWAELRREDRQRYARYMEVYAAMVDSVDQSLARIVACLDEIGELDNTLIVFTSDNGGSPEGGPGGTRSYLSQFIFSMSLPRSWERDVPSDPALIGGPRSSIHYPRGWAWASNSPFRFYKGSTYAGGVRTPMVVSWPAGLCTGDREIRRQYEYVTDVFPTLLDAAGLVAPAMRGGQPAQDRDGSSFLGVLRDAGHPETHLEQYAEYGGSRGLYRDGWKLLTSHERGTPFAEQEWRLYDMRTDPTETTDVSEQHPDVARELSKVWWDAAWHHTVFPMDDGSGRLQHIQRPAATRWERELTIRRGTPTLERCRSNKLIQLRSFDVDLILNHAPGNEGVLLAHGDQGGGYLLHIEGERLHLVYNEYGRMHATCAPMPPAAATLTLHAEALEGCRWALRVATDGANPLVALGPVMMLIGMAPLSGIDVGIDRGGPVSWELRQRRGPFPYTGTLESVTYRPGQRASYDPAVLVEATLRDEQFHD